MALVKIKECGNDMATVPTACPFAQPMSNVRSQGG
jgi:hypothetical protein